MKSKPWLLALSLIGAILPLSKMNLAPVWQRDFINYWLAPRAWWSGVNPYDVETYRAFGLELFSAANPYQFNFTYPPHALFIFAPFSALPPALAFIAWNLLSLGFFFWAARPWLPKEFPWVAAALTPAALINLQFGQTGLLSAALFLLAFRGSGIAAAVLTFKPHMGFLVAPALFRDIRTLAIAVAAAAFFIVASALIFGGWAEFFDHAVNFQGGNLAAGSEYVWVMMATTPFVGYGLVGWAVYGAAGLFLLLRNFNVFTAATATFLVAPYGMHYDMAAVCLGFAILLYVYWDRMPAWQKGVASLAFLAPVLVDFGTWLIPPLLLLGLLVQTEWFEGLRPAFRRRPGHIVPGFTVSRVNAANIRST